MIPLVIILTAVLAWLWPALEDASAFKYGRHKE